LVACCDEDVIGRTFIEGKLRLNPDQKFYGNAVSEISEALVLLETAEILNLVGDKIIRAAIERGLVHPDAVITIGGVPHVQVMRL
jgi:hypothetical protein